MGECANVCVCSVQIKPKGHSVDSQWTKRQTHHQADMGRKRAVLQPQLAVSINNSKVIAE